MAERIKLTPAELQSQAAEMKALEQEYRRLFDSVSNGLSDVNSHWSARLANNFGGKISSVQKTFSGITDDLANGARVAQISAETFETVDSQLAKIYGYNYGAVGKVINAVKDIYDRIKGKVEQGENGTAAAGSGSGNGANSQTNGTASLNENLKSYSYGDQSFSVIKGLNQEYCYNQNDYDRFWSNYYKDNVGCTSTAEAIAYSIYHNEKVTPNDMGWGDSGAKWYHSKIIEGTANCSAEHTYKTIYENIKNGTPVLFRVKNAEKQNYGHHLTAVGIRDGADPNNLGPNDLLIVDPEKGKIETLADYTKGSYNKNTIIDNDGWSLRIPK